MLPNRPRLGELLLELGYITPKQLEVAIAEQRRTGEPLGQILLRRGFLKEADLFQALADQQGVELVHPKDLDPDPEALRLLDPRFAREHRVLPYRLEGPRLHVAMAHPSDLRLLDELRYRTGREIVPKLAPESELLQVLERVYPTLQEPHQAPPRPEASSLEAEANLQALVLEASPVARLGDALLREAIAAQASDLHLEPEEGSLVVRMRVDGVLTELQRLPKEVEASLVARFKVLAGLDIAERRRPQDGRFTYTFEGRRQEVRVSTIGTLFGERAVLRILYPTGVRLGLGELGMLPEQLKAFERMIQRPSGILFVTGPTGSGKTTTLYAALEHIYTPERSFVTIEDPVELPLKGISQIPVQPKIGLGFAEILRAILRQDPDVILVGEVRDRETLDTALRAALTGHLVLATLHTKDAISTISRLLEMGAERYLLASTLIGAVAQRLVRRVCPQCGEWQALTPEEETFATAYLRARGSKGPGAPLKEKRGRGCPYCRGLGYKGRVAVFEVFAPDEGTLRLIGEGISEAGLREWARARGQKTMGEAGLVHVQEGLTTVAELMRVLGMPEE